MVQIIYRLGKIPLTLTVLERTWNTTFPYGTFPSRNVCWRVPHTPKNVRFLANSTNSSLMGHRIPTRETQRGRLMTTSGRESYAREM